MLKGYECKLWSREDALGETCFNVLETLLKPTGHSQLFADLVRVLQRLHTADPESERGPHLHF